MKWISVNDKLPKNHDQVIVYYPHYQDPVIIANFHQYKELRSEWIDIDGYSIAPTHWMPKPEPPKWLPTSLKSYSINRARGSSFPAPLFFRCVGWYGGIFGLPFLFYSKSGKNSKSRLSLSVGGAFLLSWLVHFLPLYFLLKSLTAWNGLSKRG